MANLFELLTGQMNNNTPAENRLFKMISGQKSNYLRESIPEEDKPQIEPVQYDNYGNIDYNQTLQQKQNITPRTLSEHLFGRTMTQDIQGPIGEDGKAEIQTISNFKPGFFNNLDKGVQENFRQQFAPLNWKPEKKAFGERIGEGLGSITRGLAGWGGDAWVAGQEGLDKALKRQSIRTNNEFYRNALEQQGIDTSNLNGFVTGDMFKNATLANYRNNRLSIQQAIASAKDNTTRANMILKGYENGVFTEEDAVNMLQYYGVDVSELQPSNKTREVNMKEEMLPHQIKNLDARTNATYTNANNNTERTQAYVNFINGGGKKTSIKSITPTAGMFRVKNPNGETGSIPASKVQAALKAGWELL